MPADQTHVRALQTMRQWLADGVIHGGQALPTEHALAARLGISRGTVRKVLAALTAEGLIAVRTRGRRVGAPASAAAASDQAVVLIGSGSEDRGLSETQEGSVEDACLRELHLLGRPVLLIDYQHAVPGRILATLGRRPYGIICTQFAATRGAWSEQFASWRAAGIPLVVHGHPEGFPGHDCVHTDHEAGAYELTRSLIAAGRRRIQQVWHASERPHWLQQREAGHARAMAEAGLAVLQPVNPPEEPLHSRTPDAGELDRRGRAYLGFLYGPLHGAAPPDALIALNDINAASIVAACRMMNRAVHDEVAVAGFDGNWDTGWEWPMLGLAPFLTVHKHNHAVGRALAEVLQERIAARPGQPAIVRAMPVEVVRPG